MRLFGLFLSMALALSLTAMGQAKPQTEGENSLPKGGMQINAGFGLSGNGIPVYGGMDFGVHQDMTAGFEVGYRSFSDNYWRYNSFSITGTFNYHFNRLIGLPSNFDVYAGANIGYVNWNHHWEGPAGTDEWHKSHSSGIGLGLQIGGRYFFNQNWGVNVELNGGNQLSSGRVGVTYRL
ncbi:outer membrane beta-barrel protein [Persicobacter diffluens]|uniref:Outer membrane protein beta-barrel domain-containing protein n=1 Tax=Persicobacter diffluens TaxID=981 RepID=A0AAN4VTJ8_9BACT|nr:hypothetical protein PEDI_03860 [Persicobacter diffluens]